MFWNLSPQSFHGSFYMFHLDVAVLIVLILDVIL